MLDHLFHRRQRQDERQETMMHEQQSSAEVDGSSPLENESQKNSLRKGMQAMQGHSAFAYLGDVCSSARQFGFTGTLTDALCMLTAMPGIIVEQRPEIAEYRVFCDWGRMWDDRAE